MIRVSLVSMLLLSLAWGQAQEISLRRVAVHKADFQFPTDITGEEDGPAYVLDGVNNRVVRLGERGQTREIKPQRETIFKSVGITMLGGDLLIADTPRRRLVQMATNGRVNQIIELGHGCEPVDVLVAKDLLLVSDRVNHAILAVDMQGVEQHFWGKRGPQMGEFINPGFLAQAPENRIIIGDILNRRVISASPSGRFLQFVAKPGSERGEVFRPKGVAVDSKNRIWVADGYTGALQAFNTSGRFEGIAVTDGKVLNLTTPTGIWIDSKDRIWIVESFANQVSIWSIQ